jgi:hypothetical protein
MHELMRHSTICITLDTYTQAITSESALHKPPWCRFSYGNKKRGKAS